MSEYELDKKAVKALLDFDKLREMSLRHYSDKRKVVLGQIVRKPIEGRLNKYEGFSIDVFDESMDNTEMQGKFYTDKEIEEIKAAARAEAWKQATLAGLSAQSGIPIAELEAKWDSGKFDGSKAKALRKQWRQTVASYAKRCGVDPKDLRGKIVSKEEFKKKFG